MVLYHWARCSTCRQVLRDLAERGVGTEERDIFAAPLGAADLDRLGAAGGGLRNLASSASPAFRALGRPLDGWTEAELRDAMLEEPRLLRRPILELDDGRLLVGAPAIRKGTVA